MLDMFARRMGMTARGLRSFAGLAVAVVPCSIVVHVAAELAAIGRDGCDAGFMARHAYLGVLFAACAVWFGMTAGLGRGAAERRRRCALLRAEIARRGPTENLLLLVAANLSFFGITQALEGVPIASGAVAIGVGVALAGSLMAGLLVFTFGRTIALAGLAAVLAISPRRPAAVNCRVRDRRAGTSRHATCAYSLFVPNRPPPFASRF